MVGRQTPLLGVLVPLILVLMVDGRRGRAADLAGRPGGRIRLRHRPVRRSNYLAYQLADIVAALPVRSR